VRERNADATPAAPAKPADALAPDETMTTSFARWNEGHDPAFERAAVLAKIRAG